MSYTTVVDMRSPPAAIVAKAYVSSGWNMSIEGIKARLGSIPPLRAYSAGGAIERVIKHDMPALLKVAERAKVISDSVHSSGDPYPVGIDDLDRALAELGKKD